MIICDFVRVDQGVFQIIGGGVQNLFAPGFPAAHNLGVAVRLVMEDSDWGRSHRCSLGLIDENGAKASDVTFEFTPARPPNPLPGLPQTAGLPLNVPLSFPHEGLYTVVFTLDGETLQTSPLLATSRSPEQ
ncbi:DUF6941 family protein [Streptomyces hokutonensis]|uniref:DUF6941 family protein n=1 Tax=Streptomyces hokutonensis TaxID=1306990 RepID=UPI00381AEAE7